MAFYMVQISSIVRKYEEMNMRVAMRVRSCMNAMVFLLVACFLLSFLQENAFPQQTPVNQSENSVLVEKAEKRLVKLEIKSEELKRNLDGLKAGQIENGKNIAHLEKKQENEQEKFENSINSNITIFWVVFGIVTLLGIHSLLRIPKIIDEKIDQFFDNRDKLKFIKQLIKNQQNEDSLKERTKILVLAELEDNCTKATELFRRLGFKKYKSKKISDVLDLDKNILAADFHEDQYDLLVFHELTEDWVNAFMSISTKDVYVCYSKHVLNITHREKINFANSPFTLYWRTMEALRFQAMMKRNF